MKDLQKEYQRPSLKTYGNVEEITAGNSYGEYTDFDFPRGTPSDDITFSSF
jgi:hypothetical protein